MKRILAVYDTDIDYGDRLTAYLNTRTSHPFQMVAFTSRQALMDYLNKRHVDVLLISQNVMSEEISQKDVGQIMLLTEGDVLKELSQYPAIYKYQSSDGLIRDVVKAYGEQAESERLPAGKRAKRIAVYSPLGRCMKTSLALVAGILLAKEGAALFCSLEAFSGVDMLLGGKSPGDLSDVFYYCRQGMLANKALSLVQSYREMDYISPIRCPQDLRQFSAEELNRALEILEQSRPYQYSILDVGSQITDIPGVLEHCEKIYMPVKEDAVSLEKLKNYEQYMRETGQEEILLKTQRLKLPYHHCFGGGEVYLDQLIWGEFGDYVRGTVC